jgi:hypothetical protein
MVILQLCLYGIDYALKYVRHLVIIIIIVILSSSNIYMYLEVFLEYNKIIILFGW